MQTKAPKKVLLLALGSGIAIVVIGFMKIAPELEDAEQAYYSQWWRWGYDDQPPLYTWLQMLVNRVFGVSKFSFSFLRALIFSATLWSVYIFALEFLKDKTKAVLVVLSLLFIPTFIDFTFRRLSHTSLLILVILATYLLIHRLRHHKNLLNYMLLGIVVGMGILTKYNYFLLLGSLFLLLFFDREFRNIVCDRRILLSSVLVVLIVAPHFHWLFYHQEHLLELGHSIDLKTGVAKGNGLFLISSLFASILTLVKLIGPVLILVLALFFLKQLRFRAYPKGNWLYKLFILQLLVLILVFVALDVQNIETRWLLPLFVPFLVLLIHTVDFTRPERWVRYGFYMFLTVLAIQTLRTPTEKLLGISSSVHYGFHPISNTLKKEYAKRQWVMPNVTYGGNIRLLNPDREVFSTDDFSLPQEKIDSLNAVFLRINDGTVPNAIVTDSIYNFGKEGETLFFVRF
ncbi:MAG: glycosyltransferase family 39 protein [Saonia sp.]